MGFYGSEPGLRHIVALSPEEEVADTAYETSPAMRDNLLSAISAERNPAKRAILEDSYRQDFGAPSGAVTRTSLDMGDTFAAMASAIGKPPMPTASSRSSSDDSLAQTFAAMDKAVAEKPQGSSIFRRTVGDTAVDLLRAPITSGQTLVGAANLATGGLAGKAMDAIGYDPKAAHAAISELYSPERKAADLEVQNTKGFLPTIGAMLSKPSTIQEQAIQSLPDMLMGMGIVGGVAKRIAAKAAMEATAAASAVEGATAESVQAAAAKAAADAVGLASDKLSWLGHGVEGAQAAAQNAEQIREANPDNLAGQYLQVPAGVVTGLIGRGAAKVPGFGDVENAAALRLAGVQGGKLTATGALGKRIAKGAIQEGVLEELPQSYQEQVWQNLAEGKPWDEGAAEAGAQGMLVGAAMGISAAAISRPGEKPHASELPANQSATEPLKALPSYAGPSMVVMPDGSTMTGAEYEQYRLAQMSQPAEPTLEPPAMTGAEGINPIDQASHGVTVTTDNAGHPVVDPDGLGSDAVANDLSHGLGGVNISNGKNGLVLPKDTPPESVQRVVDQINHDVEVTPPTADEVLPSAKPPVESVNPTPGLGTDLMYALSNTEPSTPVFSFIPGKEGIAGTERGMDIGYRYALVNADQLQASQRDDLSVNPNYPADLQPRDRQRATSEVQITRMANDIRPQRLGESPMVAEGAPVIGNDGAVESGNGRTLALRRAYENGKAKSYYDWLEANAEHFGFTPNQVAQLQAPVLVRLRTTPVDRVEFARQANESSALQLSPLEQAKIDAERIGHLSDLVIGENGDMPIGANRSFFTRFLSKVASPNEQANLVTQDGQLSQAGINRIRNAVFARAYGDADLISRASESLDNNVRTVTNGLLRAAPRVADIRDRIAQGDLHPVDIAPHLAKSVAEFSRLRSEGKTVSSQLAQQSMFGDNYSPEEVALLEMLDHNSRSANRVANFLNGYADAVESLGNPKQGRLLSDTAAVPSREQIIRSAAERAGGENDQPRTQELPFGQMPGGQLDTGGSERAAERGAGILPAGVEKSVPGDQRAGGPDTAQPGLAASPAAGGERSLTEQAKAAENRIKRTPKKTPAVAGVSVSESAKGETQPALPIAGETQTGVSEAVKAQQALYPNTEPPAAAPENAPTPLSRESANRQAAQFNKQGMPTDVVAHPSVPGKFAIVPRGTVDQAAHEAATSPTNAIPEPTEAQKSAGNYSKGHVRIAGLDISIENPAGSTRSGVDANGKAWQNTLLSHYGYIRGTIGRDKDHVDVFIKPGTPEDYAGPVFVIDQKKPGNGHFDEHKVMVGWDTEEAARQGYQENYSKGWDGIRAITQTDIDGFKNWLASGDTTQPFAEQDGKKPAENFQSPSENESGLSTNEPGRISDFGEKIGGARKDVWSGFKDRITQVSDDEIINQPFSKVWPEPDYQAMLDGGADPWAVGFVHAARDEVPSKPRVGYKVRGWAEKVKILRNMTAKLLSGEYSVEAVKQKLNSASMVDSATGGLGLKKLASRVELYELVGHAKSLEGISFAQHHYSLYRGRENVTMWVVEKEAKATAWSNWPSELATGDTKEQALSAFKIKYSELNTEKEKSREASFDIYSQSGAYYIGKKFGRNIMELAGPFTTIKESRDYRDSHQDELAAKLEKRKEIPQERRDTNNPRVGEDMRAGQDVTPQMFGESFGFRGVEFGNWVEQGKRQSDLNEAYDALMDMAAILEVPPKSLSLNGQLSLAFGARGTGGIHAAKAHYEDGKVVINLTKKEGAGSLGHEWWHALDNYFSRMRAKNGDMMTEALDVSLASRGSEFVANTAVRKEMIGAFGNVVKAIKNTALKARSSKLDAKRTKDYWTTGPEMSARAFESYLISKLQDQNASNDYLANIVDEATWKVAESLGFELDESYPYPTAGEIPAIRAAFDNFFQTIQSRETDKGVALFSRLESSHLDNGSRIHLEDLNAVAQASHAAFPGLPFVALENEKQAPKALRQDIEDLNASGDVAAAYHAGTVYLFQSGITDVQRALEKIPHEAAHAGLDRMFGHELDAVMLGINRSNFKVQAAALEMARKYDYSTVRATQEVLADMGPKATKLSGWDRLVAAVRNLLRKGGFVKEWTDNDVEALVLRALAAAKKNPGTHISTGTMLTQGQQTLADRIDSILAGGGSDKPIYLGETPEVLQKLGMKSLPMGMSERVAGKSMFDHGVVAREMKALADAIADPVAVIDSASTKSPSGSLVVITDLVKSDGRPIIVAVHPDGSLARVSVNEIASAYPKDNHVKTVGRWLEQHLRYANNEKRPEWQRFTGVQFPKKMPTRSAQGGKILFENDIVNRNANWGRDPFGETRLSRTDQTAPVGATSVSLKDQAKAAQAKLQGKSHIIGDSGRAYTPAQLAAMKNTGSVVNDQTIKEAAKSLWQDAGKKLAQGLVDQFRPVRDISEHAYTLLRLSKGATGAFEAFLHHGKLSLKDGAYDADVSGGVLEKVFYPLGRESTDFLRWIAGNRAERLAGEGKENLFSPQDIAAFKSLDQGTSDFDYTLESGQVTRDRTLIYRDSMKKFSEFNKNVLDMAEQSGLIDGDSRKLWEHEFYVPFYRVAEDDGGVRGMNIKSGVVRQEAFKKLKGGAQQLNDLLGNTLMNWAHLIDASSKNRAAKATLEAAKLVGAARQAEPGEKKTVWYVDKGKKVEYKVEDPYLMTAISSLEYAGLRGPAMNALSAVKHWLTIGVTASPFFKVRNLIRDSVQSIATADMSYNPAANIKKGFELTDRSSQEYVSALAGGGLIRFGTMLEGSEAKRTRQLIKQGAKDEHILDNEGKVRAFYDKFIEPAISAYNELGNRGEEINRMALYDKLIKQGMDHATASLMARDLMDFSLQGAWTSVRFLTQVVPFMNARLQGLYKLGRAMKEDPARFSMVLGSVALASLALLAAYHDDDDWKKREDWDRENYWWFKLGGTAFRIPKPFEIGAIATLAERGFELAFDKEMTNKRFMDRTLALLSSQLSMNPTPQLVKPLIDLYANQDSFSGRPIEPMGMEKLKPEYRFNQNTSMVARAISTAGNAVTGMFGQDFLSPMQTDHLVRAYFSWLGTFIVTAGDVVGRAGEPSRPTPDYWKVATGGMMADLTSAQSRYVTQMYDQAKVIEEAYGTYRLLLKEGKTEDAKQFLADNKKDLANYKNVEAVKRAETKINENIRTIERSNMDSDRKREAIIAARILQDKIARKISAGTQG